MKESIDALELPDAPSQQAGRALFDRLATPRLLQEMMHRVRDVEKSLGELREELLVRPSSHGGVQPVPSSTVVNHIFAPSHPTQLS